MTYSRGLLGTATLRKEMRTLVDLGQPARWHEQIDVPFPARAAVELPEQMQFDPVEALDALVRATESLSVRIVEGARVTGLNARGSGKDAYVEVSVDAAAGDVVVDTRNSTNTPAATRRSDRATLTARDIVLATATPALDRGPSVATMEAERSYLCAFEYPGGLPEGMYGSVESPVRSLRTVPADSGEVLFVGGNGHRTGTAVGTADKLDSLREPGVRPRGAGAVHPPNPRPRTPASAGRTVTSQRSATGPTRRTSPTWRRCGTSTRWRSRTTPLPLMPCR